MWKGLLLAALAVATLALVPALADSPGKPGEIDWKTSIPSGDAERFTLVYFTADWCPPCKVMKSDAWPDDRVEAAIAKSYTPIYVDIDADPATAEKYGITGIPTVKVLKGGTEVATQHFLDADGLLAFLEQHAE